MIGVSPGQLIDCDRRRRQQRRIAIGSAAIAATLIVLAVVGATQTPSARADFTVRAMNLTSQGYRLDAAPFAIAAAPPRGALVLGTHRDTREAFGRIGLSIPLAADLGPEDQLASYAFERFSPNSRFFKFVRPDRTILVFDLENLQNPPREYRWRYLRTGVSCSS